MIALLSSVREEGKLLTSELGKKSVIAGKPLYKGRIGDRQVVYMISGMGKTNAAHAATILIEKFSPDLVILFGAGGAYPSTGLKVGDIVVAGEEIYGDEGVLDKNGFHGTEYIGIPLLKKKARRYFNRFLLERELAAKALKSSNRVTCHLSRVTAVKTGAFVTVSTCTGTGKRARELEKRFGAICENMEGAAVAHICTLYGTPMIEIRGISNIAGQRDKSQWNIKLAGENCREVLMELLRSL